MVILLAATAGFILLAVAFAGGDQTLFLPAPLSSSHARFESDCAACHKPWKGVEESFCLDCHDRALANDTHSDKKMTRRIKASPPENLKNPGCLTCHQEHRNVKSGGYTGPAGLCVTCHSKLTPHPGLDMAGASMSCQKGGCHTYHSNITPDEIAKTDIDRLLPKTRVVLAAAPASQNRLDVAELAKMTNAPFYRKKPTITSRYEISKHFGFEATCDRCHRSKNGAIDFSPKISVCEKCHKSVTDTFVRGSHGAGGGMGAGLFGQPLGTVVGCGSCHDSHSLMMDEARIEACEKCHDSDHVKNYRGSSHYRYLVDPVFANKPQSGVDCAGCHMPRLKELGGATDHNESVSVSSKEQMARTVCAKCHGLYFSLKSLYNKVIVTSNFTYSPKGSTEGVDYTFRSVNKRERETRP